MNLTISIIAFFISLSAFGFTKVSTYSCTDNSEIIISESMLAGGKSGDSKAHGKFVDVKCSDVEQKWQSFGSENCYESKTALFSHFGDLGMVRILKGGNIYFALCELTNVVQ